MEMDAREEVPKKCESATGGERKRVDNWVEHGLADLPLRGVIWGGAPCSCGRQA